MSTDTYIAASEQERRHWQDERDGVRVFRMSDELIAAALFDWSPPVQARIEEREDGRYDLVFRRIGAPPKVS